jgi:hypothetical protein
VSEHAGRAGSNPPEETGRVALGTWLVGRLRFAGQPDSKLGEWVEPGGAIRSVRVGDEILVLHRGAILRQIDELAPSSSVVSGAKAFLPGGAAAVAP